MHTPFNRPHNSFWGGGVDAELFIIYSKSEYFHNTCNTIMIPQIENIAILDKRNVKNLSRLYVICDCMYIPMLKIELLIGLKFGLLTFLGPLFHEDYTHVRYQQQFSSNTALGCFCIVMPGHVLHL